MSKQMLRFIEFQSDMARKQAIRSAERLPAIPCRYERKRGGPCVPTQTSSDCLGCTEEFHEAKEQEALDA